MCCVRIANIVCMYNIRASHSIFIVLRLDNISHIFHLFLIMCSFLRSHLTCNRTISLQPFHAVIFYISYTYQTLCGLYGCCLCNARTVSTECLLEEKKIVSIYGRVVQLSLLHHISHVACQSISRTIEYQIFIRRNPKI